MQLSKSSASVDVLMRYRSPGAVAFEQNRPKPSPYEHVNFGKYRRYTFLEIIVPATYRAVYPLNSAGETDPFCAPRVLAYRFLETFQAPFPWKPYKFPLTGALKRISLLPAVPCRLSL